MLEALKEQVLRANVQLEENQLVISTWGNVSGIDRTANLLVIKPSGIPYRDLRIDCMTVVNLEGEVVEGATRPSTDLWTHIELYKAFGTIGGITHTHSRWATIWAQMGRHIPCYGTTHADFFFGDIPCTERLPKDSLTRDYERKTGELIARHFASGEIDYRKVPGVLVAAHGPFTWGGDASEAVHYSMVLERIAEMAFWTELGGDATALEDYYITKHYERKHGRNAYYGQGNSR